jgi:hypothetical protein
VPGDEWPEAPSNAQYKRDEPWYTGWEGHGWIVNGCPPPPFPFLDGVTDRRLFGPHGTVWLFYQSDLLEQIAHLPNIPAQWVVNQALRKLGISVGAGNSYLWRSDAPWAYPEGTPHMRWFHVTIVGNLGTTEHVAHTFNFQTLPTPDADQTDVQVQAVANAIRDQWQTFINSAGANNIQPAGLMSHNLHYSEVRVAYLEQTAPATTTTVPGRKGPKKVFHYPRPTYLVRTQYAPVTVATGGTGTAGDLPWEVACAVSLRTGKRGGANRGRVYLGPLDKSVMTTEGLYTGITQTTLGGGLGERFLTPLRTTKNLQPVIISRAYCGSAQITGTAVGGVPDSQRRRRKSVLESPVTTWGTI